MTRTPMKNAGQVSLASSLSPADHLLASVGGDAKRVTKDEVRDWISYDGDLITDPFLKHFNTVSDAQADTTLVYSSPDEGQVEAAVGDYVMVVEGEYTLKVVAEASASPDLTTAAGLKLSFVTKEATFDNVAAVLVDMATWYPEGFALRTVEEGYLYTVAASSETDNQLTTAGGVKLYIEPSSGAYSDLAFGVKANGTTDDAATYQAMASTLPSGSTLRIAGAGTRIIGSAVTFAQNELTISMDPGATVKKADGTQAMDTLITFSGDRVTLIGGTFDANVAGNANPTGRAETVRSTGDHFTAKGVEFVGSHDVAFSAALYLKGDHAALRDIVTRDTGLNAVRSWSRNIYVDGLSMFGMAGVAVHGFAQDGNGSNILNRAILRNIYAYSEDTGHIEAVLFDNDGNQGGRVTLENCEIDLPNSTGPDVIKFVYLDHVSINGLYANHPGDSGDNSSLRFQAGTNKVDLRNIDLPGNVNFDADAADTIEFLLTGASRIGRVHTSPACIQQVPGGRVIVEEGVQLLNYTNEAVNIDPNATNAQRTKIYLEALILQGTDGDEPVVQFPSGTVLEAGQVRVKDPISITDAPKRSDGAAWITDSLANDAACMQGPGGDEFLVNLAAAPFDYLTEDGPPTADGWEVGMVLRAHNPSAGDTVAFRFCTTGGTSEADAYANSETVSTGTRRHANGNVYRCSTAGTTAASGTGPSGTGTGITDGTSQWDFIATKAVFKAVASVAA